MSTAGKQFRKNLVNDKSSDSTDVLDEERNAFYAFMDQTCISYLPLREEILAGRKFGGFCPKPPN